jgi:hypothetical protein
MGEGLAPESPQVRFEESASCKDLTAAAFKYEGKKKPIQKEQLMAGAI